MAVASDKDEPACPVDHKTRDAWLAQARAAEASANQGTRSVDRPASSARKTWSQTLNSYLPWSSSSKPAQPATVATRSVADSSLNTNRAISTIPRSVGSSEACSLDRGVSVNAANHEVESGVDASGNWVYPSEKMFFDAMKRKGYDARAADMRTVVPIHNAVNERAWQQIREWEAPYLSKSNCDGPKLESFANKNDRMTPTARFNTILGYTAPFDRHDWVIDRCGIRIEYVIDFYAGRPDPRGSAGPSFYLDVRPKLNTWEGVKMRAMRWTGLA